MFFSQGGGVGFGGDSLWDVYLKQVYVGMCYSQRFSVKKGGLGLGGMVYTWSLHDPYKMVGHYPKQRGHGPIFKGSEGDSK